RLRNAHRVGFLIDFLQTLPDQRKGRHTFDNVRDLRVDGVGPAFDSLETSVAVLYLGVERRVAELGLAFDPFIERGEVGHFHAARLDLRSDAQQLDGLREGRKTICAAVFRVEVHELPDLAGVLADGLQVEMFDKHRCETFLVLDLHAVENAAVRVDADEKFLRGFEFAQDLGRVHTIYDLRFTIYDLSAGPQD